MNLRDLFEQRSAPPESLLHDVRMAGVRQKVRARRARRLAAGGGAGLVLAAAGGAVSAGVVGSDRPISPAGGIAGFQEYHQGNRVVAAASGPLTETELTFTFTPRSERLTLYWRCEVPPPWWYSLVSVGDHGVNVQHVEFLVNGDLLARATGDIWCDSPRMEDLLAEPDRWDEVGIEVGQPATVTARIVGELVDRDGNPVTPPRDAEWGVAVAEAVPFEEYAFPPRPDRLPELRVPEHGNPALLLRSDPADPLREVSGQLDWPTNGRYAVQVGAQTPAVLTVLLEGVEVGRVQLWDYHSHCAGGMSLDRALLEAPGLADLPGGTATVTVRPERAGGDWYLRLNPLGSTYC